MQEKPTGDTDNFLKEPKIAALFSGLKQIIVLNSQFLQQLKDSMETGSIESIYTIFESFAPLFILYGNVIFLSLSLSQTKSCKHRNLCR